MWSIYILQCDNGSYYTGLSMNVEERVKRHNDGTGAEFVKLRRPVLLKYVEDFDKKDEALQREIQIKKLSVKNKERLIKYGHGTRFPSPQTL